MINRKGIFSFLLITFGLTYLIEGGLILSGFRITQIPAAYGQYIIAGVMWVPSLATLITCRWVTREKITGGKLSTTGLRFGRSWKPYLVTAILLPVCFLVTYLITWILGLGQPDWRLENFYGWIAGTGADMTAAPDPTLFLVGLLFASLFVSPFVNSLFAFGEEWGWRGYLLPRLMPLGKWRAYLLLGVIWGLWHAPLVLVGFNYPGYPVLGVLGMILLTTAISIYINEVTLRYDSAILAGWCHGVFNSQGYGIWRLLFPNVNPLLGGLTGLVGILVFSAAGLLAMQWLKRNQPEGSRKVVSAPG